MTSVLTMSNLFHALLMPHTLYSVFSCQRTIRVPRRAKRSKLKARLSLPVLSALSLLLQTGGGERDRTDDLLRAKQALSQLSYTPERQWA
jgi:hypothetical protein